MDRIHPILRPQIVPGFSLHVAMSPSPETTNRFTLPPSILRALRVGSVLALAIIAWPSARSQALPVPRLVSVFPAGATIGAAQTVTVTGTDLDEPKGLQFSDPRITAQVTSTNPSVFVVNVPKQVSPGWVDLRWVGRFGVSNPRGFAIDQRQQSLVTNTNTAPASAIDVAVESAVLGRTAANQVNWFRVRAKKGRRLTARIDTRELDSRLDPVLRLADVEGRPLEQSRRGFLDVMVPEGGVFLVGVHDVTYRGGDDYVFRLILTSAPQIDFALPSVLQLGRPNQVTLYGRNLPGHRLGSRVGADGRRLEEYEVRIVVPPAGSGDGTLVEALRKPASLVLQEKSFSWHLKTRAGFSNPVLFALTTNPVVSVVTNGWVRVVPPVDFSSLFPGRGQRSGVVFSAKKGEVLWVELFSDRLGFNTDPTAVIQRLKDPQDPGSEVLVGDPVELTDIDANLGGSDFNTITRDAAVRFQAPEDGAYLIRIRDLFHTGDKGPRWPYQLGLHRESPELSVVAVPVQPLRTGDNDRVIHTVTPQLRRDDTQVLKVVAFRRQGESGDLELRVRDLPAGVSAATPRIPAGQNTGWVALTASESADLAKGYFELKLEAKAPDGRFHPVSLATLSRSVPDSNDQLSMSRLTREPLIGFSAAEKAPVTLIPTAQRFQVPANGKLAITLDVVRRGDFPAELNLKPQGRSEWDKLKAAKVSEKATNATLEFDLAEAKLPEGEHTVWLQGTLTGKYRNNLEALTQAESDLKAIEKELSMATPADKSALEKRKKESEERRKTADERAKPKDVKVMVYSRPIVVNIQPATAASAPAKP